LLKPGGLIVLRHYFKIKLKAGDFALERRVGLGDDVLAFFVHPETDIQKPNPQPR
jgi:hypothetical protein